MVTYSPMRVILNLVLLLGVALSAFGQSDLQKLVDTEHLFAQVAAESGTKRAFLEFLADDAVVFVPDRVNGKEYWTARQPSPSLLSWAPNYADISSSGILGYTTGNWEFRPKGKDDTPAAFGEFITVWLRRPNGKYRFVVDIGVNHAKPAKYSTEWTTSSVTVKDPNEKNTSPADVSNGFLQTAGQSGMAKAYSLFGADEIRMYREEKLPVIGKKAVLASLRDSKATVAFAKRSTFFGSGDISYNLGTYTMSNGGKVIEKGNSMQIWKLIRGKWQIVLDILKPVPAK